MISYDTAVLLLIAVELAFIYFKLPGSLGGK